MENRLLIPTISPGNDALTALNATTWHPFCCCTTLLCFLLAIFTRIKNILLFPTSKQSQCCAAWLWETVSRHLRLTKHGKTLFAVIQGYHFLICNLLPTLSWQSWQLCWWECKQMITTIIFYHCFEEAITTRSFSTRYATETAAEDRPCFLQWQQSSHVLAFACARKRKNNNIMIYQFQCLQVQAVISSLPLSFPMMTYAPWQRHNCFGCCPT